MAIKLKFKIEGFTSVAEVWESGLTGYAFSVLQHGRISALWISFSNGNTVKVQAVVTSVGKWDEVGTLEFQLLTKDRDVPSFIPLSPMWRNIVNASVLTIKDDEVIAESGISLRNEIGEELIIVAGALPHTVELKATFHDGDFQPEYGFEEYVQLPLQLMREQ